MLKWYYLISKEVPEGSNPDCDLWHSEGSHFLGTVSGI